MEFCDRDMTVSFYFDCINCIVDEVGDIYGNP